MFAEDHSVYFDTEMGFAVVAVYDGAQQIPVIFDNAFIEQLGMVAGTEPLALAQASDAGADAVGKTLAIGGVTYTIRGREPRDDGAHVVLRLEVTG